MEIFKASSKTNTGSMAGAIASVIRQGKEIEVQAIGAAAVNQTMKATAAARGHLAAEGFELYCRPYFSTVVIGENERTGMRIIIEGRKNG